MAAQFTSAQIKLENTDSGENITEIQNYLDTFNKEIEGGDGSASIAAVAGDAENDGEDEEATEEGTYFIDQSGHYYYQASAGQQPVMAVVSGVGEDGDGEEEFVINPETEDGDEVSRNYLSYNT